MRIPARWNSWLLAAAWLLAPLPDRAASAQSAGPLTLQWADDYLSIGGPRVPGEEVRIHYLEAYCRPRSTDADWVAHTVIGHRTTLVEASADRRRLRLLCRLNDGVVVDHTIVAGDDEVDFRLAAHNPGSTASEAHWAQPCIRVDRFTGKGPTDYIPKCFIFLDGKPTRLPTEPWATEARYTPGQVYRPQHVDPRDVNPRPLSSLVPSSGLVGCYSADERWILASAWEPYQELFQGVATCIHSDFRIGGLAPGERKEIRGKLYIVPADVERLVRRYERDFPEQAAGR